MESLVTWFTSTLGAHISREAIVFIISLFPILELDVYKRQEQLSVWIYRWDKEKYGHTGDQEDAEPPAQFSICKCDKDNASCHVDKPQVVRNDKKLAKWNVVIQCHVNDMEIWIDVYFFLKPAEPRNIDPVSYTHLDVYKRQRWAISHLR